MLLRVKTKPGTPGKSVQLVESVREGWTVSQRIIRYIGVAKTEAELEKLLELGETVKVEIRCERQPSLIAQETLVDLAIKARRDKDAIERVKELAAGAARTLVPELASVVFFVITSKLKLPKSAKVVSDRKCADFTDGRLAGFLPKRIFAGERVRFGLRGPTFARRHRFSGVLAQAPPSAAFRSAGFRRRAAQAARSGWHWGCGSRFRRALSRCRIRNKEKEIMPPASTEGHQTRNQS